MTLEIGKVNKERPVIFYGAGSMAQYFAAKLDVYGISPVCWADRDEAKQNKEICGAKVLPLAKAVSIYPGCYIYITAAESHWDGISEFLLSGQFVKKEQILNFIIHSKYKSCHFLEREITVKNHLLFPCCYPIAKRPAVRVNFNDYDDTINRYLRKRKRVIDEINKGEGDYGCHNCVFLKNQYWPFGGELAALHEVSEAICQLDCIYCTRACKAGALSEKPRVDFRAFLTALKRRGLIAGNFRVDISSDEITVDPLRDELLDAFSDYRIDVFSNAAVYNEKLASALARDGSNIIVSIDAGTPETYFAIKRRDVYDKVCSNLRQYARKGASITLKYIIITGINDNAADADGFLDLCKQLNAQKIYLSNDVAISHRQTDLPDSAIDILKYICEQAEALHFRVEMWATAFTKSDLRRLAQFSGGAPVRYFEYDKAILAHIAEWAKGFEGKKFAIYGTGIHTKNIIDNTPALQTECLLDSALEGEMIWGKDVLSLSGATELGIEAILIVALPASVPFIYRRIEHFCKENKIEVYSVNGRRLDHDEKTISETLDEYGANPANKQIIDIFRASAPFAKMRENRLRVADNREIGYCFIAPILCKFLFWLAAQAKEKGLDFLLFASRDAWALTKMIDLLDGDMVSLPQWRYFQTSRAATLIAGLKDESEIAHSMTMTFIGKPEELLCTRYRVSQDELLPRSKAESDWTYILRHTDIILRKATAERENYRKYISGLGVPETGKIGFVDFFSVGTSFWSLTRIMGRDLTGLFFERRHFDKFAHLNIKALFETKCQHISKDYIEENHYLLETVFSSPSPTCVSFDTSGNPVFGPDGRSAEQLRRLEEIHEGIISYARHIKENKVSFEKTDLALFDYFIHLLSPQRCAIESKCFENEILADEFTNRAFSLRPAERSL